MSIVEPNIVELMQNVDCKYTLVVETSKRARQLVAGALPLIDTKNMKPLKVAIEEINRGLITYERTSGSEKDY